MHVVGYVTFLEYVSHHITCLWPAKPVTTVQDHVSTFVQVATLDIWGDLQQFPAVFAVTKRGILKRCTVLFWGRNINQQRKVFTWQILCLNYRDKLLLFSWLNKQTDVKGQHSFILFYFVYMWRDPDIFLAAKHCSGYLVFLPAPVSLKWCV